MPTITEVQHLQANKKTRICRAAQSMVPLFWARAEGGWCPLLRGAKATGTCMALNGM